MKVATFANKISATAVLKVKMFLKTFALIKTKNYLFYAHTSKMLSSHMFETFSCFDNNSVNLILIVFLCSGVVVITNLGPQ